MCNPFRCSDWRAVASEHAASREWSEGQEAVVCYASLQPTATPAKRAVAIDDWPANLAMPATGLAKAQRRASASSAVEDMRNLGQLIDALAANGPLRLDRDEAVETAWALTSPELHHLLTRIRGWKRRCYCDWLAGSLALLLLQESK